MKPFASLTEAIAWWKDNAPRRRCSVLVDFTDVGIGIQRREAQRQDGYWAMGFPRSY